jgi:Zn-dependent peptidase ImmA (M78 family)
MCPFSFSIGGAKFRQGWTMFHELIHIVSKVGDKGYSKRECFNNAKNDPKKARENAAAYVYFAQNTGLP